jgi:hypothetical protein
MKGERTRILLTLAVALGVGFLVAFLRQRRLRRRRSQPTEPSEAARHRASVHAEDRGESYVTLRSLEEARMMDHTAVIMRGGVSGQVYLTVPVKYVGTDEPAFEFGEPHTATTREVAHLAAQRGVTLAVDVQLQVGIAQQSGRFAAPPFARSSPRSEVAHPAPRMLTITAGNSANSFGSTSGSGSQIARTCASYCEICVASSE